MSRLRNPARMGTRDFDTVVYAAPGLAYSSVPGLEQYTVFDTPNPTHLTRRIDLSAFADLGFGTPWPFRGRRPVERVGLRTARLLR